ncbi:hypothetical protein RCG51_06225 [Lactococcus lactis]|uniref:hypothetical protein n=1 Tax=Lactococcus lactis TaxID=1358 RepID=UPI0027F31738|nr:hypothetical protein [Lactococcus lactis]MDQ7173031.1 hypothetical protein [Lactococcus lactis]WMM05322.1 hypothetical protein RCG32_06215 [Lactococcus lactis]WMM20885.1 hypothetical protein RCG38_05045 [Lactococcus lactis]WMM21209.1 hypothetical protein RCG51_06225 [Lactococcus lactis]
MDKEERLILRSIFSSISNSTAYCFCFVKMGISIPFIVFGVLASILSIIVASLSWKYIELPSLNKVKGNNLSKQERIDEIPAMPTETVGATYRRSSRI